MTTRIGAALALCGTLTTYSCASSVPTAPDEPIAPAILAANIVAAGGLTMDRCAGPMCSDFHFNVTNDGVGCAYTVDLAGMITLTNADGTHSSAGWVLTPAAKTANDGVFKPGQVLQAMRNSGMLVDTSGPGSYSIQVTQLTNVACK